MAKIASKGLYRGIIEGGHHLTTTSDSDIASEGGVMKLEDYSNEWKRVLMPLKDFL